MTLEQALELYPETLILERGENLPVDSKLKEVTRQTFSHSSGRYSCGSALVSEMRMVCGVVWFTLAQEYLVLRQLMIQKP